MKEIIGTSNRVLEVDLTERTFSVYSVSRKERKMYLGGKGLGLKLVFDRITPGVDPLGPDNIIAFMPGVFMGTGAPCSGRFAAVTKSPLTGIFASATCGGPFGMNLKTAGWDGLLVRGASAEPVYLVVTSEGVEFRDAGDIWKQDTVTAQSMLGEKGGAIVIGPAGENLVRFANIRSGSRFLGRGGMGAVLGAKKLKAILAIGGEYKIVPTHEKTFKKFKKRGIKDIKSNDFTAIGSRKYGTLSLVSYTNSAGILPIKNFTDGTSPDAYKISGEHISEKYKTKHHTCKPCTILCGKKAVFDGEEMSVPEYETVGLLGSNLGIFDPVAIAGFNNVCGELGIDTISAGGTLAWIMEATEKGLVESNLRFGSREGVEEALRDIANLNGLGKDMALGTRGLADKFGGGEFAMQVKGMELPAYDPRGSYGMGLNYAVANRGACHLSSTIMAHEVFYGYLEPYTTRSKARWVVFNENLWNCLNSIQTCIFTSYAYLNESFFPKHLAWLHLRWSMQYAPFITTKLIVDYKIYRKLWASITGIGISRFEFIRAGERIHILERYMNTREGITKKDDTLPERLLTEGRKCDPKKRHVPLDEMLEEYYKLRGYDEDGIPKASLLKRLGI
ncbi:MAG: aldehyde ferredoxin oxidoreductase family protein [Proteobacteria bacterium]|nr:aldehyde ferredoxin oxidoreductase family protein [Pseudomonadota bacterium]